MFKQNQEESKFDLQVGDTKEFINSWSNIVEEAVLDAGQVHDPRERKYKGHGEVKLEKKKSPDQGSLTNILTIWNPKLNPIILKDSKNKPGESRPNRK